LGVPPLRGVGRPSGPPLLVLPRVVGLRPRAACHEGPAGRGQAHPAIAGPFFQSCLTRGRGNLFSQVQFIGQPETWADSHCFLLFCRQLPTVNFQLFFSVPPQPKFLSCKPTHLGATHEGVWVRIAGASGIPVWA